MTSELVKIKRARIPSRGIRGKEKARMGRVIGVDCGMAGEVDHVAAANTPQKRFLGCLCAGEQLGARVEVRDLACFRLGAGEVRQASPEFPIKARIADDECPWR